jgi:succinoglycan biosynthesis transport protein ExoP
MRSGRVEIYSENSGFHEKARRPRRNLIRFLIFLSVTAIGTVASLGYVFERSPVYESVASVIITPKASDAVEGANSTAALETGVERYQLLATPLLTGVLDLLRRQDNPLPGLPANIAELRKIISVKSFEATNIVTLRATGSDREILSVIVNSWLGLYRKTQARSQRTSADGENARLGTRIEALQNRITKKRSDVAAFRNRHDIVSMERDENRLLARLKGLTSSLNAKKEEEFSAQGRLETVAAAIRNGKPVIDLQNQRRMANLERELVVLHGKIKEFEQRYTKRYMELDPMIKAITRQRTLVEGRIAELRKEASATVLAAAEQRLASARRSVAGLAAEFNQSKARISEFSARFSEHKALVDELAEMETTHRQAGNRLMRREVNDQRGITKVTVLETAPLPIEPIWPDYGRDAGIGLGGSVGLGILMVLLFDFFTRPARLPHREPAPEPVFPRGAMAPVLEGRPVTDAVSFQPETTILDAAEIETVMAAAETETRLIIGLLLCGITPEQITALKCGDFDVVMGVVTTPLQDSRTIKLPDGLRAEFDHRLALNTRREDPVWSDHDGIPRSREDIDALIVMAAHDAGLDAPERATGDVILRSYLVYLVEQGMRLADLDLVAGPMAPGARAAYAVHAPAGAAIPFDQVETIHPVLRTPLPG